MRRIRTIVLATAALFVAGSAFAQQASPAMPAPTIFAPGIVSGGANDGAPTFAPDGKALYFERTNGRWSALLEARQVNGRWARPDLLPFAGDNDQQPAMAPDGRYMVYVSLRAVTAADGTKTRVAHLYRADRTANGWGSPVELPPTVNFSRRTFKPSVAANGDLYFMADIGATPAPQWRLFCAARQGAGYAKAEPLPFSGPGDADVDPFVAPDQSYLIFSSAGRGPQKDGHEHLFIVTREGAGWSAVRPLRYDGDTQGADDGEANVGPDGKLYFTSSRSLAVAKNRDRAAMRADLARMDEWDNGNTNVWTLPLAPYLKG